MTFKRITIITPNFPTKTFPENGVFVKQIVDAWQHTGIMTLVIAPVSLPNFIRSILKDNYQLNAADNSVLRPLHLTLSNKSYSLFDLKAFSRNQFIKAALKCVKKNPVPDLYYGKFLLHGGIAALLAGKMNDRPAFADMGESNFLVNLDKKSRALSKEIIPSLCGIVCVSERLFDEVVRLGGDPKKILLISNEADNNRFKPMNKVDCRKKLGLPQKSFIVAFTGHFIERKGPLRVLKAIELFKNEDVFGVFFGQGPQKPIGKKVLHTGSVPNEELPVWLNASDVFALPTIAEGNCNAINEAIACGIPVVSSAIGDVISQVPSSCGILVDPLDIGSIHDAIEIFYKNMDILKQYSQNCKMLSNQKIEVNRSIRILNWIKDRYYRAKAEF
jgi:glycosyltransferase involved in cell wall biosynthesis